jgi:predicted nucleic acid-binding protein
VSLFIDTSGWLALSSRTHPLHRECVTLYEMTHHLREAAYTSDYVLGEVVTSLFKNAHYAEASKFVDGIMDASRLSYVVIERVTADRFDKAWELRTQHHHRPDITFTEFASFVIMQEMGIQKVMTTNTHFQRIRMGFEKVP